MRWFLALATLAIHAQTLTPFLPPTVAQGGTATLTISFDGAGTPVTALQWGVSLPPGVTATWSTGDAATAAGKAVQCNFDSSVCLAYGINETPIGAGVVASAVLTFSAPGQDAVQLIGTLGAGSMGQGVAVSGGSASVLVSGITAPVLSPIQ